MNISLYIIVVVFLGGGGGGRIYSNILSSINFSGNATHSCSFIYLYPDETVKPLPYQEFLQNNALYSENFFEPGKWIEL